MGVSCCNYNSKPKENEVVLPQKIKYNIYEINKIAKNNTINDNIMTNSNEQDVNSRSSIGYEVEKKNENLESSSNKIKSQKNITAKNSFLGKIQESEQKYEQDQDDNSNNEAFGEIEKISVNNLINDVDKLYKQNINNNTNQNSEKISQLKRVNQVNFKSKDMEEYIKMNHYNIDNESQKKIKGDRSSNNNFENSNEEYQIESQNEENKKLNNENNKSFNNNKNYNEDKICQKFYDGENVNDDIYKIEVNELINSENFIIDNNNSDKLKSRNKNNNKYVLNNNEQNKDINGNDIFGEKSLEKKDKSKDSFDNLDNLDDFPLIDEDNEDAANSNNKKENKNFIDLNNKEQNKKINDSRNDFFSNGMNEPNNKSISEIEKKDYSLDSINEDNKVGLYQKKKISKISKEDFENNKKE